MSTTGRSKPKATIVKLIIFALVSVLLTTVVVTTLLDLDTSPTNSYKAIFSDATGLEPNDVVRIAGVEVGKVGSVSLDSRRHVAVVSFSVNSNQHLTTSTVAQINFENLIGNRYLALHPGTHPGRPLHGGGTIPLSQTINGLDLSTLFNGFQPLFNLLTPHQINQLTASIISVFQGEGGTVNDLVTQVGSLTQNLVSRQQVLDQVLDNLTPLVNTVAAHDQQLGQLIDNFDTLMRGLAGERGTIDSAITNVSQLTSNLSNVLGQALPSVNPDITGLTQVSAAVVANQQQLSNLINGLPGMLNVLVKASSTGNYLNVYICNLAVSSTGPISISLVPGFTATLPVPSGVVGATYGSQVDQVQHSKVCT